jgi:hypothetical protein
MLAFAGCGISMFYIAYHSFLFRLHKDSARTTAPMNWQQSVEVPETGRPHARKVRNGILAFFVSIIIAVAANYMTWLVGH